MTRGRERIPVINRAAFLDRRFPRWAPAAGILAFLGVWEGVARAGWVPPVFLPAPSEVLREAFQMVRSGELLGHLTVSLLRILAGLVVGGTAGLLTGLALGTFPLFEGVSGSLLSGLYPVPKIALLPLLMLWFGTGEAAKIAVIALGAFYPICWNTATGIKQVDPQLIRAAVSFGCTGRRLLTRVILPASLPVIFAGLRLSVGTCLLLVVPAEMIAAERGLGYLILHASNLMLTTQLMVGVLTVSLTGVVLTTLTDTLERYLVPWKGKH